MKVIQNINNNVSLCVDSRGVELIAFGKGIGFKKAPYKIELNQIERTFYNISNIDLKSLADIPSNIIEVSIRIISAVEKTLNINLLDTAVLSLADHINFAIIRKSQSMNIDISIRENIKQIYPELFELSIKSLDYIKEDVGIELSKDESSGIALHLLNNQVGDYRDKNQEISSIIKYSIEVIENEFNFKIDKASYNYSRFISHLNLLIKRLVRNNQSTHNINEMFNSLKKKYRKEYKCVDKISNHIQKELNLLLEDNEEMYLLLHVIRLCQRELDNL